MSCVGCVTPATDDFSARYRFVRGRAASPKNRRHGNGKKEMRGGDVKDTKLRRAVTGSKGGKMGFLMS